MLVRTFEIDVGRPLQVRTVFERKGVGRTGIEPDVEDVHDLVPLFVVVVVSEEAILGTFGKPGVRTFLLESVEDAGVDGLVDQDLTLVVGKDRDRHAPGALTREHPVRASLDHRAQAVLAGAGNEAGVVDRRKRTRTQRRSVAERLVHIDEPLRCVAEDHRLLGTPGMRIGMLQAAAGKERMTGDQRLDDAIVGVALLALVVDDAAGATFGIGTEAMGVGSEVAGIVDRERDRRGDTAGFERAGAVHPGIKVLATVAGGGVHEARTGVVGHMVAVE
ncbi:hypothetical protein D9M68_346800 [compost metagenome]